jgi:hypothetical protein
MGMESYSKLNKIAHKMNSTPFDKLHFKPCAEPFSMCCVEYLNMPSQEKRGRRSKIPKVVRLLWDLEHVYHY